MPEEVEIRVPRLGATERLVGHAARRLADCRDGGRTSLATSLRLGRREDRLVVRFDCRHRGVVATLREDNADLWTEDVVEAFLAFDDPPTRYLELEVNPLGAKFSAAVDSPNLSREGTTVRRFPFADFRADVTLREGLWSARLSIPLDLAGPVAGLDPLSRSLTLGPSVTTSRNEGVRESRPTPPARSADATFRANFFRIDRTSGEFSALFPTLADPADFHRPRSFGRFRLEP